MEIHRDDESQRVIAFIGAGRARDACGCGCAVAVAAVENLLFKEPNRLAHTMDANVGDKLVKVVALDQREKLRQRVKRQRAGHGAPPSVAAGQSSQTSVRGIGGRWAGGACVWSWLVIFLEAIV